MGNCFGFHGADEANPSNTDSIRPSTPGTSRDYSNGVGHSATSSSAGLSRFSAAFSDDACVSGDILPTPHLKVYSFADLKNSTRNFKSDMVLGIGGFGTVYRGWVDEASLQPSKSGIGIMVAIKKLNPESMQGFEEWQSEVNFLGRLSHPNLVKLLGYCWEAKEMLLVYEFVQKGSLENHLFRRNAATEPLPWDIRLRIAIGAARGLAFLHASDSIYRDFKASNILLDKSFNAKISDFGLAKLGPSAGNSHVTTRVMGTQGYAAPEYIATGLLNFRLCTALALCSGLHSWCYLTLSLMMLHVLTLGHLYVKSDVYGFGVVLLELLTGSRALDSRRPHGQKNLVEWAKPLLSQKRKLKTIMDDRLQGQYSSKAAAQAAHLTLRCLEHEPRNRPPMKEVAEVLEQIAALEKPKESKSSRSTRSSTSSHHRGLSARSYHSPRQSSR